MYEVYRLPNPPPKKMQPDTNPPLTSDLRGHSGHVYLLRAFADCSSKKL